MNQDILNFCEEYKKHLEINKNVIDNPIEYSKDMGIRKEFFVYVRNYIPNTFSALNDYRTIELDDEDLKYLYNKYSKQLVQEMEDNIKSIKELYGKEI